MQEPARELAAYLDAFECRDASVPVVCNVTATATRDAAVLRERLKQQITAPVRWSASMQTLQGIDASPVLEVGTGSVLKGLHRRIHPDTRCSSVGERGALDAFLAEIATAPGSA
jgi:[acyl-carrier-protein] S-malonyltransferase